MGDDVYHNGAFMLAANFSFYSSFRPRGPTPTPPKPSIPFDYGTADGYEFFLSLPPLSEVNARLFEGKSPYFQEIVDHPNYDQFWQARSIWKYATNIVPAVLNVGGWFDAEDPMGPLYMYPKHPEEQPEDGQPARDGTVVARRMVASGTAAALATSRSPSRPASTSARTSSSPGSCTT